MRLAQLAQLKKKPKVRSMKAIERELWALCRNICHLRDRYPTDNVSCYTCPQRPLTGSNKQLGHGHPKGALGASMKFDLRILRWQCWNCNINYGGMGATFWKNLEHELGKDAADALFLECQASKGRPVNARDHYTGLIDYYKTFLKAVV